MDIRPIDADGVRTLLASVCDPEIPVLTIEDLGVLRDVRVSGREVTVVITPTYSGCPAMRAIEQDIEQVLMEAGCRTVT
ncbi:MAG: iron-sulfur cluster assembly protein, partial [Gammaproteobacteria bacterium]|nr:iron-sulfur cluster assembly protein [Gammaproteobacteria bacterium]